MSSKPLQMLWSIALLSLSGIGAAWATGGCVNSPENPTVVLAGLGGAAAALPWLCAKFGGFRAKR